MKHIFKPRVVGFPISDSVISLHLDLILQKFQRIASEVLQCIDCDIGGQKYVRQKFKNSSHFGFGAMPQKFMFSVVLVIALLGCSLPDVKGEKQSAIQFDYPPFLDERVINQGPNEETQNYLKKLAQEYEITLLYQKERERQRLKNLNDEDDDSSEMANGYFEAIPQPLSYKQTGDVIGKDKRTKYMSLCHFKICNMGKKRNLYFNDPLVRPQE